MELKQEIKAVLSKCSNNEVRVEYEKRLAESNLVREENLNSHFCAYFVPYNPKTKSILIGDHKKSGLWLMPGGHIDKDETLIETVNREIKEELGIREFFKEAPKPFLLSITNIKHGVRSCKKHFDVWHLVETDGSDFNIDYTEYNEVRWLTIPEARKIVTDAANLQALDVIETL